MDTEQTIKTLTARVAALEQVILQLHFGLAGELGMSGSALPRLIYHHLELAPALDQETRIALQMLADRMVSVDPQHPAFLQQLRRDHPPE